MRESLKEKAKRLRNSRRVTLVEYDSRRARAIVMGDHGQYRLRLYNEGDHHFKAICDCPSSELWCSHAIAALKVWRWQVRPWWARLLWRIGIWFARTLQGKEIDLD
jgi:uncharacterized Zn finger protein